MAYKRLDGKKAATGLLGAVALYFLGSWMADAFEDSSTAADGASIDPDVMTAGDADSDAVASGLESRPEITPMPEVKDPAPPQVTPAAAQPPAPAPTPTDLTQGAATTTSPQSGTSTSKTSDDDKPAWFKKINPNVQAIIAGGIMGGGGATIAALAQKNALEDKKASEDRAREDQKRRGSIPAFGQGIIAGARR